MKKSESFIHVILSCKNQGNEMHAGYEIHTVRKKARFPLTAAGNRAKDKKQKPYIKSPLRITMMFFLTDVLKLIAISTLFASFHRLKPVITFTIF